MGRAAVGRIINPRGPQAPLGAAGPPPREKRGEKREKERGKDEEKKREITYFMSKISQKFYLGDCVRSKKSSVLRSSTKNRMRKSSKIRTEIERQIV